MAMRLPDPQRGEEIALFRLGIVGDLLTRDLAPGELHDELVALAEHPRRPPGAKTTRVYHWKTLQSWYYAAKRGGLRELRPASRQRGFALALPAERRDLLLQIRKEHPTASAEVIHRTAVDQGLFAEDDVSVSTLRRLFASAGLSRLGLNRAERRQRYRWEAPRPCALWHADVCHVWVRDPVLGRPRKVLVHGLLDDHSRFVVALEARDAEREVDMLSVLCTALLRFPAPDALYLDNGACYRGQTLALALARLGVRLVHAQPHDPKARGKMERFWRTMRQRATDHLPTGASLQDVNSALLAFLDADYHTRPHAGLLGESPLRRFQAGLRDLPRPKTAKELALALEITVSRRVSGDATFQVEGHTYEVRGAHLAGRMVEVVLDPFTDRPLRVSFDGRPVVFGACEPRKNARRARPVVTDLPEPTAPFDPIAALLARARQETP